MTLIESFEAQPEAESDLTWDQIYCFGRWAVKQGMEVEEVPDQAAVDGHILVVHSDAIEAA